MNEALLKELTELRNKLREKKDGDGKTPRVCSDDSLAEIAKLKPKSKGDLLYVSGIGKAFVENYGDEFFAVVKKYNDQSVKSNLLQPEMRETLKNLEHRLVNINKRNRLLYMPKTSANFTCDLVSRDKSAQGQNFNVRLAEFVRRFEPNKRFMLCDLSGGDAKAEERYKAVSKVVREAMRSLRETGDNSLYIAYPFVKGRMTGEDFSVRAPLALFPVEIIKEPETICLKMDASKDVLFNSNLILSYYKFNNIQAALESNVLEEVDNYRFYDQIVKYYGETGINITVPAGGGITPFEEYTADKFPKFRQGEFVLEESIVLGKFPLYSSALQRDFKDITESENINSLLNNLLIRAEDIDIYSDSEDMGEQPEVIAAEEKNLNYINDLNTSQEAAIFNINNTDKLVVQGPPGTGKSQTITSLIVDFVNKGKNVLMVSQKKAALDVIYSRLGRLNKYALFIHDVKNKDEFYDQLSEIYAVEKQSDYDKAGFASVSDRIDRDISRLDAVAQKLYYDAEYGAGVYRIYEESAGSNLKNSDPAKITAFERNVPTEFFALGYENIKTLKKFFANPYTVETYGSYYDLVGEFPWLASVKGDFSRAQVAELIAQLDSITDLYAHNRSKNFIARAFSKGEYRKPVKAFIKNNFAGATKDVKKLLAKNPQILRDGFGKYNEFVSLRAGFNELDADQKLFFGAAYNVAGLFEKSIIEILDEIVELSALHYINEFETENRDLLVTVDNFDLIVREIGMLVDSKKDLSRERFQSALTGNFCDCIKNSKRFGDMTRITENKRKWDIARYVKRFGFELFNGIRIWLMTPEVVSEVLPLENGLFDLVIFDEASQIYIEKGVPSIARAKKVVIAGDHKQLRPSSLGVGRMDYDDEEQETDDLNAALEEESLLDLARFKYPEIMLNYHYRSKYEELISFSNYAFYKGKLNVSPNTFAPQDKPIKVHRVENGLWTDRTNKAEAEKTIELIRRTLDGRKDSETLGVITFNSSQRDLILDMLDDLCVADPEFAEKYHAETARKENGEDVGLFIKNIENVQGDERDIIIFSLAYAKNAQGKVVRNFGWLNQTGGENRLNVAISRAKRHVDIVTSIRPEELKVDDLTNDGPRIFKKYLEYAYCISDGNISGAKDVLMSFGGGERNGRTEQNDEFTLEVARALSDAGLNVERNVGIGGYKIDIAVKDSGGKYLLGIDCDCSVYNNTPSTRERDVHRAKYLTARGWKLYRIWSPLWWKNPKKEIDNIKSKLY